ncbi:hypothetical protein D2T29_12835 [Sinirhodobacter populi]|uniref:Thioredoxin-like fold domain-containing protein n=1 Tax=Paenirhodobacter populi TaxID=2306993 RepID=A0A443KCL6_9RHOB|nr:thioredoxin fold domain-containing protein [Sinirhodobacter populi]RWR30551.1 hypothetical protein D2T29_12835 [Sinirhodobacter populi]
MTQFKRIMAGSLLTSLFAIVSASAQDLPGGYVSDLTNPDAVVNGIDQGTVKDQIKDSEELQSPFTHAVQLEGRTGIAYVSRNGRYFLRGVIFDTWTGKTIQTMDDLRDAQSNMNLGKLGVDDKDVTPVYFGQGPKKVTVFLDPLCPFCAQFLDQILSDPSYVEDYTFTLLPVAYLGEESSKAVVALECAKDKEAAKKALVTHDTRWMMGQPKPLEGECDPQPIMQRMIMAQTLGVSGVPFIIAPEGGIARGLPADVRTFLATN